MKCSHFVDPATNSVAIVCSSRRAPVCREGAGPGHQPCGKEGVYQCDWKLTKMYTCDQHICADHALEVAPGKHLCPLHQAQYRDWLKRRGQDPATVPARSHPQGRS